MTTTKEMLEFYDELIDDAVRCGGDYGEFPMNPEDEKRFREYAKPIRSIILAVEEWKEQVADAEKSLIAIDKDIYLKTGEWGQKMVAVAQRVRDFGEEEK